MRSISTWVYISALATGASACVSQSQKESQAVRAPAASKSPCDWLTQAGQTASGNHCRGLDPYKTFIASAATEVGDKPWNPPADWTEKQKAELVDSARKKATALAVERARGLCPSAQCKVLGTGVLKVTEENGKEYAFAVTYSGHDPGIDPVSEPKPSSEK